MGKVYCVELVQFGERVFGDVVDLVVGYVQHSKPCHILQRHLKDVTITCTYNYLLRYLANSKMFLISN